MTDKTLSNKFYVAVTAVALAFIAALAFLWVGPGVDALRGNASAAAPLYDEDTVVGIYEAASPAVVQVINLERGGFGGTLHPTGQGTGFLIDSEGYIVTNNHVVDGADQVKVVLSADRSVTANVIGRSAARDLALLKVDASDVAGITPLTLGDSSTLKPGQMAIALGDPFGLTDSITVGVISGLDRSLSSSLQRPISSVIQTDAAINPGNSGGPLLNSSGEVIGINTAIESSGVGSGTGIGFAVPVNSLKEVLPRLKEGGVVQPAYLGIRGMAITPALKDALGLPVDRGVYIVGVTVDGPAAKAGIVASGAGQGGQPGAGGDIITAIDGRTVASVDDIASYLNGKSPGDPVTLTVVRDGSTISVNVTLGTWPSSQPKVTTQPDEDEIPLLPINPWDWFRRYRGQLP